MSSGGAFVRRGHSPRNGWAPRWSSALTWGLNLYEMAEMGEASVTVSRRKCSSPKPYPWRLSRGINQIVKKRYE